MGNVAVMLFFVTNTGNWDIIFSLLIHGRWWYLHIFWRSLIKVNGKGRQNLILLNVIDDLMYELQFCFFLSPNRNLHFASGFHTENKTKEAGRLWAQDFPNSRECFSKSGYRGYGFVRAFAVTIATMIFKTALLHLVALRYFWTSGSKFVEHRCPRILLTFCKLQLWFESRKAF